MTDPAFILNPEPSVESPLVNVPVPLKVPFKTIVLGMVGLFPKGSEQLLLTVFELVWPVKLTKLKVTLLQLNVAPPLSKVTVPALALKVGDPEIVKFPAIVIFPDGALNVPPVITSALFKSAPLAKVKLLPVLTVTVPEAENVPVD